MEKQLKLFENGTASYFSAEILIEMPRERLLNLLLENNFISRNSAFPPQSFLKDIERLKAIVLERMH